MSKMLEFLELLRPREHVQENIDLTMEESEAFIRKRKASDTGGT